MDRHVQFYHKAWTELQTNRGHAKFRFEELAIDFASNCVVPEYIH